MRRDMRLVRLTSISRSIGSPRTSDPETRPVRLSRHKHAPASHRAPSRSLTCRCGSRGETRSFASVADQVQPQRPRLVKCNVGQGSRSFTRTAFLDETWPWPNMELPRGQGQQQQKSIGRHERVFRLMCAHRVSNLPSTAKVCLSLLFCFSAPQCMALWRAVRPIAKVLRDFSGNM